jgi:hypothetical protein
MRTHVASPWRAKLKCISLALALPDPNRVTGASRLRTLAGRPNPVTTATGSTSWISPVCPVPRRSFRASVIVRPCLRHW